MYNLIILAAICCIGAQKVPAVMDCQTQNWLEIVTGDALL